MKSALILFTFFATLVLATHSNALAAPRQGVTFDSDVEAGLKQQMIDDLAFMGQIQGNAPTALHNTIFGKVNGAAYLSWFNKRIFSIGKNDCGNPHAVACVIPFQNPNKMWVTLNYTQFNHPQIARISVIYHEARHSESQNGNWGHATCPTPFLNDQGQPMVSIWTGASLQGQPACDKTPLGSYGSQTILLKNIALKCTNCTEKVKQDADLFSQDQLGRIIDPQAKAKMIADFSAP
jgi:hypothetical protein